MINSIIYDHYEGTVNNMDLLEVLFTKSWILKI